VADVVSVAEISAEDARLRSRPSASLDAPATANSNPSRQLVWRETSSAKSSAAVGEEASYSSTGAESPSAFKVRTVVDRLRPKLVTTMLAPSSTTCLATALAIERLVKIPVMR
jgi:hypothetical protein